MTAVTHSRTLPFLVLGLIALGLIVSGVGYLAYVAHANRAEDQDRRAAEQRAADEKAYHERERERIKWAKEKLAEYDQQIIFMANDLARYKLRRESEGDSAELDALERQARETAKGYLELREDLLKKHPELSR